MKQLLDNFITKLNLTTLLKSSYFTPISDTFFKISFGSLPETDKMIKALLAKQADDCRIEHLTESGKRVTIQLIHEEAGRVYKDKDGYKRNALKTANTILINIKEPTTLDDIASKLPTL